MPSVADPFVRRVVDGFGEFQIGGIGLQPVGQRRPLPQQAFMRHFDDVDAGTPIGDQDDLSFFLRIEPRIVESNVA